MRELNDARAETMLMDRGGGDRGALAHLPAAAGAGLNHYHTALFRTLRVADPGLRADCARHVN